MAKYLSISQHFFFLSLIVFKFFLHTEETLKQFSLKMCNFKKITLYEIWRKIWHEWFMDGSNDLK